MVERKKGGCRKGHTNNPNGRPKGVANKTTTKMREALLQVYDNIGGVKAMTAWAMEEKNKTDFYKIITKLIPVEIKNPDGEEFITKNLIEIKFVNNENNNDNN